MSGSHFVRRFQVLLVPLVLGLALTACQSATQTRVIALTALNSSGVTGALTLTAVDGGHTRVDVAVDPAGYQDMPAHIHPGACATLVPQPKYPLQSVQFGRSSTVLSASFAELTAGGLALNIHASNDYLGTYTACAELR